MLSQGSDIINFETMDTIFVQKELKNCVPSKILKINIFLCKNLELQT